MSKWCLVDSKGKLCSCVFDSREEAVKLQEVLHDRGTITNVSVRRMIPVTDEQYKVIQKWHKFF